MLFWLTLYMTHHTQFRVLYYVGRKKALIELNKILITSWEYPNVTWRISSYVLTYLRLSTECADKLATTEPEPHEWHDTRKAACRQYAPTTHPMDHTQVNLTPTAHTRTLTSQNIYSTLMCGLQIFAGSLPKIYICRPTINRVCDRYPCLC